MISRILNENNNNNNKLSKLIASLDFVSIHDLDPE